MPNCIILRFTWAMYYYRFLSSMYVHPTGGKKDLVQSALLRRKELAKKTGLLLTDVDGFISEFNSMRRMMMQQFKVLYRCILTSSISQSLVIFLSHTVVHTHRVQTWTQILIPLCNRRNQISVELRAKKLKLLEVEVVASVLNKLC